MAVGRWEKLRLKAYELALLHLRTHAEEVCTYSPEGKKDYQTDEAEAKEKLEEERSDSKNKVVGAAAAEGNIEAGNSVAFHHLLRSLNSG